MSNLAVIESLTRLSNSKMGNPRYRVHFSDGSSAVTSDNSAWAYEVGNSEWLGATVRIIWSGSKIRYAERVA